jgi:hypothetical protein
MISAVPSVSSVHVELDGRLPSTAGRTDETTKLASLYPPRPYDTRSHMYTGPLVIATATPSF